MVFKEVPIKENASLKFGVGINQTAWNKGGDGVLFEISIVDEKSQNNVIFSQYIDPKNNIELSYMCKYFQPYIYILGVRLGIGFLGS